MSQWNSAQWNTNQWNGSGIASGFPLTWFTTVQPGGTLVVRGLYFTDTIRYGFSTTGLTADEIVAARFVVKQNIEDTATLVSLAIDQGVSGSGSITNVGGISASLYFVISTGGLTPNQTYIYELTATDATGATASWVGVIRVFD